MIGEIDKDFYCTSFLSEKVTERNLDGSFIERIMCKAEGTYLDEDFCCGMCTCKKRKWPTPKQFKEEYGYEWEGAVYYLINDHWEPAFDVGYNRIYFADGEPIKVCACTPFGIPPKDWRPE